MRALVWVLRAFLFFTLFAFALSNQHDVVVRWFFGYEWRAPMVFVVLAAFGAGCALGAIALTPAWWRHRRAALGRSPVPPQHSTVDSAEISNAGTPVSMPNPPDIEAPSRFPEDTRR